MKKYILICFAVLCSTILTAQVPQIERDAIMALYNSTDGANWTDNTNWGSGNPVSTWYGITVENIGGNDHITAIILYNNNLGGLPTSDWSNLSELKL